MKTVCIITCYNQPDYVRARSLRAAVERMPDAELVVVKNSSKGVLRYPQVLWRLLVTRITKNPDVYILTFRGYEMVPFVWLLTLGKWFVFDEFINLVEWVAYEHQKIKPGSILYKIVWAYYRLLLAMPQKILADTEAHADYSAQLMGIHVDKYVVVPVATDETVFTPLSKSPKRDPNAPLQVFYYSNMLPLHGIAYVLGAAEKLQGKPIRYVISGGDAKTEAAVEAVRKKGVDIEYHRWIPFDLLPQYAHNSDLSLGGPFGGTLQANMVITGKTYQFMAAGAATVVGRIDHKTPFVDKKNCLLVDQTSVDSLADAFLWALEHRNKLPEIGAAGRKTYVEEMSVERVREILEAELV